MPTMLYVLLFAAAIGSVLLSEALGASLAANLLWTSWMLAPYLVLTAVTVLVEKRTSLPATAVATLLGAVGALGPALIATLVESDVAARLVPISQAGAIAALVPTCRWLISHVDAKPPAGG